MDISELEPPSALHDPHEQHNEEYDHLRRVNGNALSQRAFEAHQVYGTRRGVNNFLGVEDTEFLLKKSVGSRMPAAQGSGNVLSIQRAVEMGALDTLIAFLKQQPPEYVNSLRNSHGETLLHTAVLHQQTTLVQYLLQHGADPRVRLPKSHHEVKEPVDTELDPTIISVAPRSENFRYSRMMPAAEATPVHYACANGNLELVKLLLATSIRHKSRPFEIEPVGSLLVYAITAGHPDIVEYLTVKKHLEQDCYDEEGNNAVAIAALALGHPEKSSRLKQILHILARCDHIDFNHKNLYGLTPYDTAEESHVKEMIYKLGGRTARILDMDKLLRWNRERSQVEYTYRQDRPRGIQLRDRDGAATTS